MNQRRASLYVFLTTLIAIVDAILKVFAIKRLPEEGSHLSSPIDFALHKNPGIAFNIPIPLPIVIVASTIIIVLLARFAYNSWQNRPDRAIAAWLIIAGALGNMIDRIVHGFTTDYIILFTRSAINLSDVLIFLGTALLLYYTESKTHKEKDVHK